MERRHYDGYRGDHYCHKEKEQTWFGSMLQGKWGCTQPRNGYGSNLPSVLQGLFPFYDNSGTLFRKNNVFSTYMSGTIKGSAGMCQDVVRNHQKREKSKKVPRFEDLWIFKDHTELKFSLLPVHLDTSWS